jgi:hypothetical protein
MTSYVTMAAFEAHRQDLFRAAESTHRTAKSPKLRFGLFERARGTGASTRRARRAAGRAEVAVARA